MTPKEMLLTAPDGQLDHSLFATIEQWDDEPTGLQVLEVLDKSIHCALASSFVIKVLNIFLDQALERENKTLEDLVPLATWRN